MEIENKKRIIISLILMIVIIIFFIIYFITNQEQETIDLNEFIQENETEKEENVQVEESKKEIIVHITGEVKNEGIVYLEEGDRIIDAIEKAGGETKEADLSQVNLAYVLADGQKIYIPNKNEKIEEYIIGENGTTETGTQSTGKVNINTATESELDSLPGIGSSIAQRIIAYREENGKFSSIEDIKNVSGIGDSKYEEIKDKITV